MRLIQSGGSGKASACPKQQLKHSRFGRSAIHRLSNPHANQALRIAYTVDLERSDTEAQLRSSHWIITMAPPNRRSTRTGRGGTTTIAQTRQQFEYTSDAFSKRSREMKARIKCNAPMARC